MRNSHKWTEEEKEWVRKYNLTHSRKETTEEFCKQFNTSISESAIKGILSRKESIGIGTKKKNYYTEEQTEWLIKNIPLYKTSREAAEKFNEKFNAKITRNCINNFSQYNRDKIPLRTRCWTEEELQIAKEYYKTHNSNTTAKFLNEKFKTDFFTAVKVRNCAKNHHWKEHSNEKVYTEEQRQWVKENYSKYRMKDLPKAFNERFGTNRTYPAISKLCFYSGICDKREERVIGGEYKECGYTYIKIDDKPKAKRKNYKPKHIIIWEEHYGKVPEGYAITFKDGNVDNFDLDNLVCISYKTRGILNFNKWNNKGDITDTAIAYGEFLNYQEKNGLRTICQIKDGKIVGKFKSCREIERNLGMDQGDIYKCLIGEKHYKTYRGFVWKYEDLIKEGDLY